MIRRYWIAASVAVLMGQSARATDYTWNTTTGNWGVAGSWTPAGGPPVAADNAFLGSGANATVSDARAINDVTLNASSAILTIGGFGSALAVGGTFHMQNGTFNLNTFGMLTINGAFNSDASTTINLNAGTLDGTGGAAWFGAVNWNGTQLDGSGTLVSNGFMTMNAAGSMNIRGSKTLRIAGGANWNGGSLSLSSGTKLDIAGSVLQNTFNGTISHSGAGTSILDISAASSAFYKTGGTGTTTINDGVIVNLAGSAFLQAQVGTINIATSGTYAGILDAFAGATIDFSNSAAVSTFNTGAVATVTGTLKFRQQTFNVNAATMTIGGTGTFEMTNSAILQGTGTLNINSPFTWDVSTMQGSGVTVAKGGAALSGGSRQVLGTHRFELDSAGTWSGGNITVGSTAIFRVMPGRTLTGSVSNVSISASGTGGIFDVQGTFIKNTGTLTTTVADGIDFRVGAGGAVDVQTGTFDIFTTGTYAGSLNIAAGATLKLTNSGKQHAINTGTSATIAATGLFQVSGTTVNFNAPSTTIGGAGTFQLFGSANLLGTGDIDIQSPLLWTSGTFGGSGTATINAVSTIPGGGQVIGSRTVVVNANTTWSSGGMNLAPAATLRISAGNTLDVTFGAFMNPTGGNGGTIDVQGTYRKTTATTANFGSGLNLNLASGGIIDLQAGALTNNATGVYAGTLNVGAGTTMTLLNSLGSHTFNTGAQAAIGTGGTLLFQASTFTFNAASTSFSGTGTFEHSSGTILGSGTLNLNAPFKWSGGGMGGSGTTSVNAGATIAGGGPLSGTRVLEFDSDANWTSGQITLGGGSSILRVKVNRMLDMALDGFISPSAGGGAFQLDGTLRKSAGTGFANIQDQVTTTLSSTGTINVQTGTLTISGTGTYAGSLDIAGSSTLVMNNGARTHTFNSGAAVAIASAAKLEFQAATFNVNTSLAINGSGKFLQTSGNTTFSAGSGLSFTGPAGTVEMVGGTMIIPGTLNVPTLTVTGGTLTLGSPSTVTAGFTFSGGSIIGSGNLSITGAFNWTGGTIGGSASNVDPLAATNLAGGSKTLGGGKLLRLNANSTWTAGSLDIQATSILRVQPNQLLDNSFAASLTNTGTLDVQGTFAKTAGGGTTTIGSSGAVTVAAGGKLEVTSGTLAVSSSANLTNFSGTTLTAGTYRAVGSSLDFSSRTIQTVGLNTMIELSGAAATFTSLNSLTTNNGTILVMGGNTFTPTAASVNSSGTINVGSASTFNKPITVQSGGVLSGGGTVAGVTVIQAGGSVRPGNSPGLLTVINGIDLSGDYQFELPGESANNTGGNPGTDFDTIGVPSTGSVVVRPSSTFSVRMGVQAGPTVNLNSNFWRTPGGLQWTLATTTNGLVTGPGGGALPTLLPAAFTLFDVSAGATVNYSSFGSFGLQAVNNIPLNTGRLELTWNHINPVPEPSTLLGLGALGLAGLRLVRRRTTT